MAKYLKLDHVFSHEYDGDIEDGNIEISFWDAGKDDYISAIVAEEDIVSFDENESLQKVISDLNKELSDTKNQLEEMTIERDRLRGVKADLLQSNKQYLSQIKELEHIHDSVVDTYRDCIAIIVDRIM